MRRPRRVKPPEPAKFPVRQVERSSQFFEFTGQERLFDLDDEPLHKKGSYIARCMEFRSERVKKKIGE